MSTGKEITDRFPTDPAIHRKIAVGDMQEAEQAFSRLTHGLAPGMIVVAYWHSPQFGVERGFPIRSAHGLGFILSGMTLSRCTNLRFFVMPQSDAPEARTILFE